MGGAATEEAIEGARRVVSTGSSEIDKMLGGGIP